MNNIKKSIAIVTLALFSATSASVIAPASALAAPHRPYHPVHRQQGHNNISKAGKAILIAGGIAGITAAIVGSVKHHKKYKSYK